MSQDYQEILDRSYGPQMLLTFIGVAGGIGAKYLIGDLSTWSMSGIVDVFLKSPLQLLGGSLLLVASVLSLLGAGWIGIGALTSKWADIHPGDRVVRVGVIGLLTLCLGLIVYIAVQFLFLALLAVLLSSVIQRVFTSTKRFQYTRE